MYQELWKLAETQIEDVPLRRLVLTILERQKTQLSKCRRRNSTFIPSRAGCSSISCR